MPALALTAPADAWLQIDSLADGTPVCVQLVKGAAVTGARPGSKGHSTTYEHQEQAALLTVLSDAQAVLEEVFALLVGSGDPQDCLLQLMTHGWSAPDRWARLEMVSGLPAVHCTSARAMTKVSLHVFNMCCHYCIAGAWAHDNRQ
jgi:hypothetical protein